MKSLFILFSLSLFTSNIDARKDPGEYWQGLVRKEAMAELGQNLVDVSKVTSISTIKNHCNTPTERRSSQLRPNVSAYGNDAQLKEKKYYTKDFEPRPNLSVYVDDTKLENKKSFTKNFEPRPNVSAYSGDVKPKDKKSFTTDFEPRPSATAYRDDVKPEDEKSFTTNFKSEDEKSSTMDF